MDRETLTPEDNEILNNALKALYHLSIKYDTEPQSEFVSSLYHPDINEPEFKIKVKATHFGRLHKSQLLKNPKYLDMFK